MIKVEEFDKLMYSDNKFDNITANFIGAFGMIFGNWKEGNVVKPYEFIWDNPILAEMAENQYAEECLDDFNDDVDETFYDPYAGCEIWDNCNYEW